MDTARETPGFLHLKPLRLGGEWLHMCIKHRETASYLMEQAALDSLIVMAMVDEDTRSRCRVQDDGIMVLLKVPRGRAEGKGKVEQMVSMRLWITPQKVITTREADVNPIIELGRRLDTGEGPKTPGSFLTDLIEVHLDDVERHVEVVEDETARLSDLIAAHKLSDDACSDMAATATRISGFLRHLSPQRPVLETLTAKGHAVLDEHDRMRLEDSLDRLTRFLETLHGLRDQLDILNAQVTRTQDRRLNRSSHTLAAAATIFLPLGFLTGLFGVNLMGLPLASDPSGFWMLLAACGVLAGFLLLFLYLRKLL